MHDKLETPIHIIEWEMMNKSTFYPLSMISSFGVRCLVHPFNVIKTRIQIQQHSELYSGTIDAFRKIVRYEGFSALYKGFWLSSFQLVSGVTYITTYETMRHFLQRNNVTDVSVKAMTGGAAASLVNQTIVVPFDVISQHMMVLGMAQGKSKQIINPLELDFLGKSKLHIANLIVSGIYKKDGIGGFYRGYFASVCSYVPNSAFWWTFYHFYQDKLHRILPSESSSLLIQCMAAPLGGMTTTFLTNPLDTIRSRLQVQRSGGFVNTTLTLWREEELGIFWKGLPPRLLQSMIFSVMIVFGYESVKRLSISEEYKDRICW